MSESNELDIVDMVGALWQRKLFITAVAGAVAFVALIVSLLLPKSYMSSSQILIIRPVASNESIARAHEVPFRTFEYVISNWQNLVETIRQLNLQQNGEPMEPEQLSGSVKVRMLPDIDILQVDVWMPSADEAQKVNQHLVDLGLKRYYEFTVTETAEASAQLDTMAGKAEEEFKKYNTLFRDFMVGAQLKQVEQHLEVLGQAMKEVSQRLQISIGMKGSEEAQVDRFTKEVTDRSPNAQLEGHRQIPAELFPSFASTPNAEAPQISASTQIQDPTFLKAESELVMSRAELAGHDAQMKALNQRMAELTTDYTTTEKLFNERTAEKRALESELTARQTAYESIYKNRAESAMNVTTRRYALRVLSSPSLPTKKASPMTTLNVLGGAVLGALVSAVWILSESFRRRRPV